MADVFDPFKQPAQPQGPEIADPFSPGYKPQEPSLADQAVGGFRRFVTDPIVSAGKGAVGAAEAAVGLGNLVTGGRVGRVADATGLSKELAYRKAVLEEHLTPEQQARNKEVQDATGFVDSGAAMLSNPSTIFHMGVEALPAMAAGGIVSRGITAAAPKVGQVLGGALGEGAVSAGATAEEVRQATPDRELSLGQGLLAAGAGVLTAGIGSAAGKFAKSRGIGDPETMLAGAATKSTKGPIQRTAEGIFSEGFLEELPQSMQEQIAQNLALGKPWDENVGKAGAMGAIVGGAIGGGANLLNPGTRQPAAPGTSDQPPPPLQLPAPGGTTINVPPGQAAPDAGLADEAAQIYANSVYAARAAHDAEQEALKASGKEDQPQIAGLLPPPSAVAPQLGEEPIGVIQDHVRQTAADNATSIYAARAAEDESLAKLAAQGPISGVAAAAIKSGLATQQAETRQGAVDQELGPKESPLSMPDAVTEVDQVKAKRLGQVLAMAPSGNLAAVQLARSQDPKSWTVVPHPSGQGFALAPTSYLTGQQQEAVSKLQEAGAPADVSAPSAAPAAPQASNAAAQRVPLKDVQTAKRMADAETAKTGIEHEVVPHPTKRDAFSFRPVQNSQPFTQREQPQATEQDAVSAQDSQQSVGTFEQVPTDSSQATAGDAISNAASEARAAIDEIVSEAATSPTNDLEHPTAAQAMAGNYKKARIPSSLVHGLPITIENPDGSVRVDPNGEWASGVSGHYGYIRSATGADGDRLDVNIGPRPELPTIFVVNQVNPASQKFDEHKVMIGYATAAEAEAAYRANYPKEWQGFGSIVETTTEGLKSWIKDGDAKSEFSPSAKSESVPELGTTVPDLGARLTYSNEIPWELSDNIRPTTPSEASRMEKVAQQLKRKRMPLVAWDGINTFGIYYSPYDAVYFRPQGVIGFGTRLLESDGSLNAAFAMAHELFHNLFPKNLSKIAGFNIRDVTTANPTRVMEGAIVQEAFLAWRKGGPLGDMLEYPFANYRDKVGNKQFTETLRQEVAAQLGAMYITNPSLLREEMPLAFSLMQEVVNAVKPFDSKPEGEIGGARSAVQRALQRWRPAAERADDAADGQDRGADRASARDGRAGAGMDSGPSLRPEGQFHRYDATSPRGAAAGNAAATVEPAAERVEQPAARPAQRDVAKTLEVIPNGPVTDETPVVTLRKQQPDALTLVGVHHSQREGINTLYGNMYGSATSRAAGAEWARLKESGVDRRLRERVYFYHQDSSDIPFAESNVQGGHVYRTKLTNILDPRSATAMRMFKEAGRDKTGALNEVKFEKLVIDGGYDGYVNLSPNGKRSMIVVLGGNVPVEYLGKTRDVGAVPKGLYLKGGAVEAWSGPAFRAMNYNPPRDATAADILRYEGVELGNSDIERAAKAAAKNIGIDLSSIPANRTRWVTRTREAARRYGGDADIRPVAGVDGWTILFEDGDGAFIVDNGYAKRPSKLEVRGDDAPVPQRNQAKLDDFKSGNVSKILRKKDWAVLTAENPKGKALSSAMNQARNNRLERDLQKMGAQYEKVVGKYGGNDEHSYIVVGITQQQAHDLRDKYQQDSVLTREGLEHFDGSVTQATGTVTEHATAPQDFYTRTASGAMFTIDLGDRTKLTKIPDAVAPALTEEETKLLGEGRNRVATLVEVMDELPPTADFKHAALAGKAARGWYKRSREAVYRVYGKDAPRFISLMAALSPQTSVKLNFYNTARAWHAWDKAGRPLDHAKIAKIFDRVLINDAGFEDGKNAMKAWSNNGIRALTTISPDTMQLSGPKVESFRRNLMGDMQEVTNDRHNANFGGISQTLFGGLKTAASELLVKGPGYVAFSARIRQAAAQLTKEEGDQWTPAEVQETLWSFWKALYDLTTAKGETRTAVQLVRAGALTHEMVRRVPDLGSFFGEQDYREITGPGAASDLGSRGVEPEGAAREAGPIAATPAVERIARRVDRLVEKRAALEKLNAEVKAQNEALDEGGVARAREIEELDEEIARAMADEDAPDRPDELMMQGRPLWKSGMLEAIKTKAPFAKDGNIAVPMLKSWLAARTKDGTVKGEELKWSGVDEWLDALVESDVKKISRGEVERFIEQNGVQVEDKMLGERPLPPGIKQITLASGRVKMEGSGAEAIGDDAVDASVLLAARFERLAQQWQKNGDEEKARRYFIRSEAMVEWSESAEGYGTSEETKFNRPDLVLPGGTNYKELLLTLPEALSGEYGRFVRWAGENGVTDRARLRRAYNEKENLYREWRRIAEPERVDTLGDIIERNDNVGRGGEFRSSHFDQPNILAHIRFNERTSADGKRVLFIEEIQSDWAQLGRKQGFQPQKKSMEALQEEYWSIKERLRAIPSDAKQAQVAEAEALRRREAEIIDVMNRGHDAVRDGVPVAPFVGKTEAWVALALKRMIRYAADNGFDAVAWTNGEQQADRYSLSKQVDSVTVWSNGSGGYHFEAKKDGRNVVSEPDANGISGSSLADHIGKDLAQKAVDDIAAGKDAKYTGVDLDVGGGGMKAFYDKIVPNVANDLLKKLGGGRVGTVKIATDSVKGVWEHHTDLPGFDLTPEMTEAAQRPNALFLKRVVKGDSGRQYTPEQKAFFDSAGRTVDEKSLKEKIGDLWKDAGKKLAQGLVDQFAPIKELSGQAYALARLSKGASGAFEALLRFGKLKLRDGVYDVDLSGGVIDKVFAPLQGEGSDFLWWVAANRAERLSAEDRENLFTAADIAAGKSLASGDVSFDYTLQNGQVTRDRAAIFADAQRQFDAFNRNVMDMAEQSGLIDGQSRQFWEHEFYVPFYRVMEEGDARGVSIKSGLARQEAFKKLKGGAEKLNSDLLANTLRNWAHLIDASAKNRAAAATLEAAANLGVAVEAPEETVRQMGKSMGLRKNVAWFVDGGKQRFFLVEDQPVLDAINGLEFAGMRGALMDAMSTFKHVLTIGVTASPFFKIRNLIRDSVQAIAVSGLGYNPLQNVKEGFEASNHQGQMYASMLAGGGVIHFGTMLESREADRVRQLIKMGVKDSSILDSESKLQQFYDTMIEPAVIAYNELGNRSEEINRAALYKKLTSQGMNHAQASLMSRDLMDFSMQGAWTGIRFLTQTVPFLNARMQGIYKLGRGAKEDPRKMAFVLGATALASIVLLLGYKDDDDWKKREDWDRDLYWWFKIGGVAFRIPKPFEIGAIASVAERGVELMVSDEMNGKRFAERMMAMLSDNLSMNPVPQLVKPVLDVYSNKNSFTGRPIEGMGMERMQSEARYNSRTTMVARAASTAGNMVTGVAGKEFLSPLQIDHLVRGYFGWLGAFVIGSADQVARPATNQIDQPAKDLTKFLSGGMVSSTPERGSRYVTQMYGEAKTLEQAHATWRDMLNKGDVVRANAFAQQNNDLLMRYGMVERVKRVQSTLNKRIRQIEVDASMSSAEKRDAIDRINEQKDRSARLLATGLSRMGAR